MPNIFRKRFFLLYSVICSCGISPWKYLIPLKIPLQRWKFWNKYWSEQWPLLEETGTCSWIRAKYRPQQLNDTVIRRQLLTILCVLLRPAREYNFVLVAATITSRTRGLQRLIQCERVYLWWSGYFFFIFILEALGAKIHREKQDGEGRLDLLYYYY